MKNLISIVRISLACLIISLPMIATFHESQVLAQGTVSEKGDQTSSTLPISLASKGTPPSPTVFRHPKANYNNVTHFAIYADDLKRARAFYENVFDWKFSEWGGQPDFYQIKTSDAGESAIRGALQKRPESHKGTGFNGFECTISVEDIAKTAASIEKAGGKILVAEVEIPTVGRFIKFSDTEGNIAAAIQYALNDRR